QAVLHLISNAGFTSPEPGFRRGAPVIGMNDPFPIRSADRPISLAAGAGVVDAAIGTRRPNELRQAVGQKPEMFFAASQLLLGAALLLGSQGQKLGRPAKGVGEAVEVANACWS